MRNALILCVLCFFCYPVFSQLKLGIQAGPSVSSILEKNTIPKWDSTKKPYYLNRTSVYAGIFATYPINKKKTLVFQTAIAFQGMGNKFLRSYDTLKVRRQVDTVFVDSKLIVNYINIPLNIAFSIKLGQKSTFNISAGPYFSLFLNGKETYSVQTFRRDSTKDNRKDSVDLKSVRFSTNKTPFETGKGPSRMNQIDIGYNARVFFDLGGIFITGFYSESFKTFYRASYPATFKHKHIGASIGVWLNKKQVIL